ncbi:hypothetical protein JM18_004008 [Phytophthora kernoviae]|uniref:PX domain-containing protein n=2 Tax=Phytophthora kernoviae TaxID=325452 RepID=A0A922APA5_9STRA|nr:hypothetical protein G195_006333 [Phytophthora kernoviae 00238/432]KAG2527102.1 hypothetical protein JM18_004008 [Phytophthora kernoviae]
MGDPHHLMTPAPALQPKHIWPKCYSEPLTFLKKIDHVEICDFKIVGGVVFYALDVYLHHQFSRIPTNNKQEQPKAREQKPDYRVLRRFSEFDSLREEVTIASQHQLMASCVYCDSIRVFLFACYRRPRVFIKLCTGPEARKKLLQQFINRLIEYAMGHPKSNMANNNAAPPSEATVDLAFLFKDRVCICEEVKLTSRVGNLRKIRRVQVSPTSDNKCSYVVEVFTSSQSMTRIPTSLKAADSALTTTKGHQSVTLFHHPDAHSEKQLADFVKLRDELYESCKTAHANTVCSFCREVARCLLLGAVLPGSVLTWMLPQHQRTKAVQRFVESLLLLAISCPVVHSDACLCQEKLPRQLSKFLFETPESVA